MVFPKKIDFAKLGLTLSFALASLFLSQMGNNFEPFSLALAYALMGAEFSLPLAALIGFFPSLLNGSWTIILLYAGQALLLWLGFFLHNRLYPAAPRTTGLFPMLVLSVDLGLFVGISPFNAYILPFFALNAITQKVLLAAIIFLLATIFYVALRAMSKKALKCRLRTDEMAFCILFFALIGIGLCRFLSVNAYMGIAFFILLLFACATKDCSTLFCAFCLSLPPLFTVGLSPERFFLYGFAITVFIKSGRLAAACALLAVFFSYGYLDGLYAYPTALLVQSLLSALLPCLFFVLLPSTLIRYLENKLIFYREKHLSRIAINRNRTAIGEKLFEISSVFREIQTAFHSLGSNEAEQGARDYMRSCVIDDACKHCPQAPHCPENARKEGLDKLIELGCLKGKVSLIDLPRALTEICVNQNGVLHALNKQLADYRTYMTETENAASGRSLLAGQAQGVSEILRNLALEQSEPLRIYADKERALEIALLKVGIVCSELLIFGEEDNLTLSLITFGNADVKKIAAVCSHLFGTTMMISEKINLSCDKFCCILHKKPRFDAAFGVAYAKKAGETASGDTHSVIKIDERKFMVALSDGMGSGEYARKVSECTISLLESFYRAKMPSSLILSAINKLMTFNQEESFACVDIAIIDLGNGQADIVKIGSPIGFILSGNTVKVLEGSSLPMGILDALRPDFATHELLPNDILLFLSDGVADAFGSTADLYEILRRVPIHNPQQLVDTLMQQALQAYGGVAKDDMTAVAVRLFESIA